MRYGDDRRIPAWAVGIMMTLVGVLTTSSVSLGYYIFSGLARNVEAAGLAIGRIEQRIGILEIRADTQEKFCRIKSDKQKEK